MCKIFEKSIFKINMKKNIIYKILICMVGFFLWFLLTCPETNIESVRIWPNCDDDPMYILSAVAQPKLLWNMVEYIVLNVLDGSVGIMFDCCIYGRKHENAYRTMAHIKHKYTVDKRDVKMFATQYYCSCQDINFKPLYIKLVERHASCSPRAQMKTVIYPEMKENSTAICTKVAFNYLNPIHLIEWFEYQKLMGVATVLIMLQTLNSEAYAVFKHYEMEGIVQLFSFPDVLPGCIDRGFEKNRWHMFQSVHDEQLAVFTCEQLLQGFAFVAVIDFDEYIIHDKFMTYSEFIKSELLPLHPDAAGFVLNVSFFLTDWGISGTGNMLTTKYIRRTNPRYERYKNIYLPRRIKTLDTHTIHPKKGYKRCKIANDTNAHQHSNVVEMITLGYCLAFSNDRNPYRIGSFKRPRYDKLGYNSNMLKSEAASNRLLLKGIA